MPKIIYGIDDAIASFFSVVRTLATKAQWGDFAR
jgi:hypothetical protein